MTIPKNRTKYCYSLWDLLFINGEGNVYPCGHMKTGPVGNIYKEDLSNIWNNSIKLKLLRKLTLAGRLPCIKSCNILYEEGINSTPPPKNLPLNPEHLKIQLGTSCNLRCIMCRQNHRSGHSLSESILKKRINWKPVKKIIFQGGEILFMKDAKNIYTWLTEKMGKKVDLITNGTLIDKIWSERLVNGSNWIMISVNAATAETHELINRGSSFKKVIDSIQALIKIKKMRNSPCQIIYRFTIVPENIYEIPAGIQLADSLGCDAINFGYDKQTVPDFLHLNKTSAIDIKAKIARLVRQNKLHLDIEKERLQCLGLWK